MKSWILIFVTLATSAIVISCTSAKVREPQSEMPLSSNTKVKVPSAEELFLRAKFELASQPHNVHNGQDLELNFRRPVVNLQDSIYDARYGKPGYRLMANFYHRGNFYIARIPEAGVKNVYFTLSYFPPLIAGQYIAAHTFLRFEMNDDQTIELVALMPNEATVDQMRGKDPATLIAGLPIEFPASIDYRIKNAAISAEAQWTKQDPQQQYNLIRGEFGNFIQIVRLESMEMRFNEFWEGGTPSTEYKFEKFTPDQLNAILWTGLEKSQSDGVHEAYNTLGYNCTITAFDIIEKGAKVKDRRLLILRDYLEKVLPVTSSSKVIYYGAEYDTVMAEDPTLADESYAAYKTVILTPNREPIYQPCTANMKKALCKNLKSALRALQFNRPELMGTKPSLIDEDL